MYETKGVKGHSANQKSPTSLYQYTHFWVFSPNRVSTSMYPGRGFGSISGEYDQPQQTSAMPTRKLPSQKAQWASVLPRKPAQGHLGWLLDVPFRCWYIMAGICFCLPDLWVTWSVGWKLGSGLLQGTKFFPWQRQAGQPITTHVYWKKASQSHICIQAIVCATPADIPSTRVNNIARYKAEE